MIEQLVTFGCSFTKDSYQDTWADILAKKMNLQLVNRGQRGAGANYISKRILTSHDLNSETSLVAVMWPCADRYDLWADQSVPHLLEDQIYASWANGVKPMLTDMHGNHRHDKGFILNGSIPRGYKHHYWKYLHSSYQAVHDWYAYIILTQLFLKAKQIAYVMMSAFPLEYPLHCHKSDFTIESDIFDLIDLEHFLGPCVEHGFQPWCYANNLKFYDTHHPDTSAHEIWLDRFVIDRVKKIIRQLPHDK